jgi:hypothetical protein
MLGEPCSDAGHFVWEEAPTEYASIILDSMTGNRPANRARQTERGRDGAQFVHWPGGVDVWQVLLVKRLPVPCPS